MVEVLLNRNSLILDRVHELGAEAWGIRNSLILYRIHEEGWKYRWLWMEWGLSEKRRDNWQGHSASLSNTRKPMNKRQEMLWFLDIIKSNMLILKFLFEDFILTILILVKRSMAFTSLTEIATANTLTNFMVFIPGMLLNFICTVRKSLWDEIRDTRKCPHRDWSHL